MESNKRIILLNLEIETIMISLYQKFHCIKNLDEVRLLLLMLTIL